MRVEIINGRKVIMTGDPVKPLTKRHVLMTHDLDEHGKLRQDREPEEKKEETDGKNRT